MRRPRAIRQRSLHIPQKPAALIPGKRDEIRAAKAVRAGPKRDHPEHGRHLLRLLQRLPRRQRGALLRHHGHPLFGLHLRLDHDVGPETFLLECGRFAGHRGAEEGEWRGGV